MYSGRILKIIQPESLSICQTAENCIVFCFLCPPQNFGVHDPPVTEDYSDSERLKNVIASFLMQQFSTTFHGNWAPQILPPWQW